MTFYIRVFVKLVGMILHADEKQAMIGPKLRLVGESVRLASRV